MTRSSEFDPWLGKEDHPPSDIVTPRLVAGFEATFDPILACTDAVPIGLHWCLSAPAVPEASLGQDGHPARGRFMPPIPLPRRMWAGGEVTLLQPFETGDSVDKRSKIDKISKKTGKSGTLWFVRVAHEYRVGEKTCIRETQNIVYREAATQMMVPPPATREPQKFDSEIDFAVSPVTLFRFSALTFNAHRIHYDQSYAREVELYPDLVIHGPMQAIALLNFASGLWEQSPKTFRYRGTAPALGAQTLRLGANLRAGETCELSVLTETGAQTMEAVARW